MENTIQVLKALSDETRLSIVRLLSDNKTKTCADLSVFFPELSQPTMSHHFKVLIEANILTMSKDGTSCIYSLNALELKKIGIDVSKI